MIVELFEQRAPIQTARFIELAEANAYDNNPFHRIDDDFVIQAGQITTAPSGVDISPMVDDFHPELQHAQPGALALAKTSVEDSGTTQFYLIDSPHPSPRLQPPCVWPADRGRGRSQGA